MKTVIQELITYFEQQKEQGCKNWCIEDLLAQLYQAKEMEKEYLVGAYNEGQNNPYEYSEENEVNWYNGERYYNETFKAE